MNKDIPELKDQGVRIGYSLCDVMELSSISMINGLVMMKMQLLLRTTFDTDMTLANIKMLLRLYLLFCVVLFVTSSKNDHKEEKEQVTTEPISECLMC